MRRRCIATHATPIPRTGVEAGLPRHPAPESPGGLKPPLHPRVGGMIARGYGSRAMRRNTASFLILGLAVPLFLSLPQVSPAGQTQRERVEDFNRQLAEELWEKAIAAKGGRERLHAVRNMVRISDYEYSVGLFKRARSLIVGIAVFPDKSWSWHDYRPGKLGLSVTMHNDERDLFWLTYPDESPRRLEVDKSAPNYLIAWQLTYLMETQWVRPLPLAVTDGQVESKQVKIIRVRAEPFEAKYYLDPETFLPLRVEILKANQVDDYPHQWYEFSDYVNVDGIQMPSKVRYNPKSPKYPQSFQFNVEYDPEVFERPPTIEGGPYAWRPKATPSRDPSHE